MRVHNFDPNFWHLLAAEPGIESSFQRWNLILITILAFVVLGAFVAGLGSEAIHKPVATTVPAQATHAVHHS